MFTGIIKGLAPAVTVASRVGGARIAIDLGPLAGDTAYGDSLCISGACLTVADRHGTVCEFDVLDETLARTTLGNLRPGDKVNIEPSLRVGDPLGGHFVLGHVDAVGEIAALTPAGDTAVMKVAVPASLVPEMVPKGSVAVDGISLTLVDVGDSFFTCALIPTTLKETTLGFKKSGDRVNVETDILGKHVARVLGKAGRSSAITLDKLREAGFA